MKKALIRIAVRSQFLATSCDRALGRARLMLERYLGLADGLAPEVGSRGVVVPPMLGIDEDMRGWSFYMILEHNTIVNRSISAIVRQLARSEPLSGAAVIDLKKGVMPSPAAGEEWLSKFHDSVIEHVDSVAGLPGLRGTRTAWHPVFGEFDAHEWNCMFALHLGIHYRQAEYVVRRAATGSAETGARGAGRA